MYFIFIILFFNLNSFVTIGGYNHNKRYGFDYGVNCIVFYKVFKSSCFGVYKTKINKNISIGLSYNFILDCFKLKNSSLMNINFYFEFLVLGVKVIFAIGPSLNFNKILLLNTKCALTYTEYKTTTFVGLNEGFKIYDFNKN